jgi:hypothetical protein
MGASGDEPPHAVKAARVAAAAVTGKYLMVIALSSSLMGLALRLRRAPAVPVAASG